MNLYFFPKSNNERTLYEVLGRSGCYDQIQVFQHFFDLNKIGILLKQTLFWASATRQLIKIHVYYWYSTHYVYKNHLALMFGACCRTCCGWKTPHNGWLLFFLKWKTNNGTIQSDFVNCRSIWFFNSINSCPCTLFITIFSNCVIFILCFLLM